METAFALDQDTMIKKLDELSDEELVLLYEETDWLAPAYYLRWRWKGKFPQLTESQLMIMVQTSSPLAKQELYKRAKQNHYKASDEILAMLTQEGDEEAKDILITSYMPHVSQNIARLQKKGRFFRGYETNDLVQEGIIGLFKAVRDFKVEKKTKFKIFARHVIEKHINSLILQSSNNKLRTLNDAFSYHTPIGGSDSEITFEQLLKSDTYQPEDVVMKHETFYGIWNTLTPLEKIVLWYYAKDFSYQEIGDIVYPSDEKTADQKKKAVDNTVQRIKKKKREYEEQFRKM